MKFMLIAVTILFLASTTSNSQNIIDKIFKPKEAKNAIVGTAGTVLFVSEVNIAYERKVISFGQKSKSSLWMKGRYTKFSGLVDQSGESFVDISAMALLGSGRSYTEIGLGVGLFPAQPAVYPTGSVGYRYQRNRGGIIFRTGMGYPDIFYVGLGYAF